MNKVDLKGMTRQELVELLAGIGKERYRADQIIRWLHLQRVREIDKMSNLSLSCRQHLHDFSYIGQLELVKEELSRCSPSVRRWNGAAGSPRRSPGPPP